MDPAAGKVPGTNDAARFATPKATNSLFGLIVCENLAAFCFADTMLSKNPITDANLVSSFNDKSSNPMDGTHIAVDVV